MFTTVRADELLRAVSVVLFNTLLLSDDECLSPRLPEVQLLSSLFADRAHTLMHALFFLCFFFSLCASACFRIIVLKCNNHSCSCVVSVPVLLLTSSTCQINHKIVLLTLSMCVVSVPTSVTDFVHMSNKS